MQNKPVFKGSVNHGEKVGRTIGFPTANLNVSIAPKTLTHGVHAAWVTFNSTQYKGALYYGPRLVFNEIQDVLEIYLLNFTGELYGKELVFTIERFIRPPMNFSSLIDLQTQLKKDIADVENSLTNKV